MRIDDDAAESALPSHVRPGYRSGREEGEGRTDSLLVRRGGTRSTAGGAPDEVGSSNQKSVSIARTETSRESVETLVSGGSACSATTSVQSATSDTSRPGTAPR